MTISCAGMIRTSIARGFAVIALCFASSVGQAATFTYSLNGTLAKDSGNGPSLVAYGGTIAPTGFNFGVNEGLSLSGTGAVDVYSIDIKFYFNDLNASSDGYQRILDFKNRATDQGLYSTNTALTFFFRATGTLPSLAPELSRMVRYLIFC